MKQTFILFLAILTSVPVLAQEKPCSPKTALSFGISNYNRLTGFIMDIGVKKILNDKHQVRLYLSPYLSISDEDKDNSSIEEESTDYSIGLGADYLRIMTTRDHINLFGGTGLLFQYRQSNMNMKRSISDGISLQSDEQNIISTMIAIRGTLGAEWMVRHNIGIHSEYVLTGSTEWREREQTQDTYNPETHNERNTKMSHILLRSTVLTGLSIYF